MRALFPGNSFVAPYEGKNLRLAIGEAPGAQEAEEGIPFVGGSGRWLNVIYGKAGEKFSECSRINTIQCRPPDNIYPTDSQARSYIPEKDAHASVQQCFRNHVKPFLESRPWKRIDTFGDKPLKFILEKSGGVTNWRGSILPVPALGPAPLAVPTFHPAYIARDQSMLPVAINDIRKNLVVEPERYEIFPTLEQVKRFTAKKFAFDLETNRWNSKEIQLCGLSASPFEAIVVPFTGEYIKELKRIFWEAEEVIGQNILSFDLPSLKANGINIRGPKECKVWDIMLLHHLRFPTFPHDLEFIGKQFTNKGAWKADKAVYEIYNARDTDVTFRCFQPLYDLCEQAKLLDIYTYISWPLALICKSMTDAGVMVNGNRLKELRKEYLEEIERLERDLPEILRPFYETRSKRRPAPEGTIGKVGKPLKYIYEPYQEKITPWRSSAVKMKYLYETLGLPVQRNIKTKEPSVDKNCLDKLYHRTKHPILKTLKELNKFATLLSGFLKEGEEDEESRLVHASFSVHGTSTGRLSSSGPNMQNVPIKTRYMYVSRFPNGRLIDADFSGIENRLTCYFANDKVRGARLEDRKFSEHKYLVSRFFDIPYDKVEKSHDKDSPYAICKIIVHGCVPGETEILTETGWLRIDEWSGQKIAQWNTEGVITFTDPLAYHNYETEQSLLHLKGTYIDFRATLEHKFVRQQRSTLNWVNETASSLQEKKHPIPVNGNYLLGKDSTDCRLAVAIQADSALYGNHAVFHLVRKRKIDRLKSLLDPSEYTESPCKCHSMGVRIRIKSVAVKRIAHVLTNKKFNWNLLNLSHNRALEVLHELEFWDGSRGKSSCVYQSCEEINVDILQALAHLHGLTALKNINNRRETSLGRRPVFTLSFSRWNLASIRTKDSLPSIKQKVYCFTVPSGYFLARHAGRVIVSGNSDRVMGAKKISDQFDMDFETVKKVQAAWKSEISDTIRWQNRVMAEAVRIGRVENPFGRKMWIWTSGSGPEAVSFYPQSTAADVIFRAMISLMYKRIGWPEDWALRVTSVLCPLPEPAELVASVHDELLTDSPEELVDEVEKTVTTAMSQPYPELGGMVFPISVGAFRSWGDAEG